ncbi:unnamed protein product [Nesidiocoris tenuis]|uniref:MSP domain-containing protein n=2 Tax=Nesidiocoris tenuis TaxID=355587 RepID=A0A6H5G1J1_9HEMI|nr:Hypothetical protein NTJ_13242 [Nesidiocoris tenuis]CAA9996398.1 unnamed protein product [Nesidiocoris tenuis]CAA9996406.1 unnamed protein product [Nesidiocoris tenuis]
MAKQEQILIIDPTNELKFVGPFNLISLTSMKLTNPTENHVLFKIKTTAPRRYCVRPNSGLVKPNSTVSIQVCLQPSYFDPNEKNKHKFMVQTLLWNPRGTLSQDDAWREAKPENLMDTKLKVVFEVPEGESGEVKKTTATTTEIYPPAESDSSRYVSGDSPTNDSELLSKTRKEMERILDKDNLREENQALKDELRALRNKLDSSREQWERAAGQAQTGFQTPIIVLAIVAGLVGVILGKFLL